MPEVIAMAKVDLKKVFKNLYSPSARQSSLVAVPPFTYFMIDGAGDPNDCPRFEDAMQALYSLSYGLKFATKGQDPPTDYSVMPPEGLWWADDPADFAAPRKDKWRWTLMIMQPPAVTPEQFAALVEETSRKKDLPAVRDVRLETLEEGICVQILHIGPYSEEGPTLERLHRFAQEQGYELHGRHHEIYLSDVRRTAPDKLKTVLRHPVRRQAGAQGGRSGLTGSLAWSG
jgi:hypothetical protein